MDEVKRVCVSPVAATHRSARLCYIQPQQDGAGLLGYLFTASRQSERRVSHPAVYG